MMRTTRPIIVNYFIQTTSFAKIWIWNQLTPATNCDFLPGLFLLFHALNKNANDTTICERLLFRPENVRPSNFHEKYLNFLRTFMKSILENVPAVSIILKFRDFFWSSGWRQLNSVKYQKNFSYVDVKRKTSCTKKTKKKLKLKF